MKVTEYLMLVFALAGANSPQCDCFQVKLHLKVLFLMKKIIFSAL